MPPIPSPFPSTRTLERRTKALRDAGADPLDLQLLLLEWARGQINALYFDGEYTPRWPWERTGCLPAECEDYDPCERCNAIATVLNAPVVPREMLRHVLHRAQHAGARIPSTLAQLLDVGAGAGDRDDSLSHSELETTTN